MSLSFFRPPEDGIAISARDLQKTYYGKVPKTALYGVSLDIPAGSIFGLLGPNGAGKSSFINILAGTVIKTAGQACVWGADIDDNPRQARANIGIVPQELNIDAYFTPRETLEMQAGLFGVPPSERRSDAILDMVGLGDQAHTYARRLSGGMRRRLLVAKAMVHAPPILVLDEPTAGVDVELRRSLWQYVRRLHEAGTTIILTTHYLEEAEELCDEIAIVNHGEIIACEPTGQLLKRLDQRLLVVTPREPLAAVPDSLKDLAIRLKPNGDLEITYRNSETGIGRLLERVREAGIGVADLSTDQPNLEDVFVAMTTETA